MNPPISPDKPTDARGSVVQSTSFDAWGRRRNPSNWTYSNIPATLFNRGYTGHSLPRPLGEHLDVFGLINMNGRMYDPILARFLSVDPYVQAADYTQSYNRYSYCLNNPLIYTDPSGYTPQHEWDIERNMRVNRRTHMMGLINSGAMDDAYINATSRCYSYVKWLMQGPGHEAGYTYEEWKRSKQVEEYKEILESYNIWMSYLADVIIYGTIDGKEVTIPVKNAIVMVDCGPDINFVYEAQGGADNGLSNWWNSHWTAKVIPDVLYINVGAVYNFVGGGSANTGYALPIRGKNAFHLYKTTTLIFKGGIHGNIGVNLGYSSYVGDARNFDFEKTFGGIGTRGFESDIIFGFGGTISSIDVNGGRLYSYDFGLGLSIGASINIGSVTYVERLW